MSQFYDTTDPGSLQEAPGHNFFNSLSGLSPMMKSVADISSLDSGAEEASQSSSLDCATIPSENKNSASGSEEAIFGLDPLADSLLNTNSVIGSEEATNIQDDKSEETPRQPLLRTLFSEDKSGSDVAGKAFFDSLISQLDNTSPVSPQSGPRSPDVLFMDPQEKDQFYEAWIPSARTQDVLHAMATASQGSFFPEKRDLTMPGILVTEIMGDNVKTLMSELNLDGTQTRICLKVDDVTQDEAGLQRLIKAKCFGAAVNLTSRLLSVIGQGAGTAAHPTRHSPYSLQLWFTRLALFVKMRKFQYVDLEIQAFGDLDRPDIYYQFYPDVFTGRKGSMAPFSFRLLVAECPQFLGNYTLALDRLYMLLTVVQQILQNLENGYAEDGPQKAELSDYQRKASLELWQCRESKILYSILNCMLAQKDFGMAISIMALLLDRNPAKAAEIHSALGRIYLQLGDVQSATSCFSQVTVLRSQMPTSIKHTVEDHIHKALMCIVQNSYAEAHKNFAQALALEPGNPVLVNNMAVCLLYMGRLKEAISLMEGMVMQRSPDGTPLGPVSPKTLHEGLLFNTCILYELESFHCDRKKQQVLSVVAQHAGDSFQTACLKIDPKAVLERK